MALLPLESGRKEKNMVKTYAATVAHQANSSTFKIPMRYPVEVNGKLGFIFLEAEMTKAADEQKYAIVMKFMQARPPIDNIILHIVKKWGLTEIPTINFMDDFHVLI